MTEEKNTESTYDSRDRKNSFYLVIVVEKAETSPIH